MNKSVLFLLALITFVTSTRVEPLVNLDAPKLSIPYSTLYFSCDDNCLNVRINGMDLKLPSNPKDLKIWNAIKTMNFYVYPKDIISITASDNNAKLAIVATLIFRKQDGTEKTYSTGQGWYCNDVPGVTIAPNDGTTNYGKLKNLDPTALWISDTIASYPKKQVTCSFQIPSTCSVDA